MRPAFARLASGLLAACLSATIFAQETKVAAQPTPPAAPARPNFTHSFGSAPASDSGATCAISATAPKGSAEKGQMMKFVVDRKNTGPNGVGWLTFVVATGKSKSLVQVQSLLKSAFARAADSPAGAELAKLGDITLGRELRVVAQGGGGVEMAYNPPLRTGNPVLTAGETAAFAKLLGP